MEPTVRPGCRTGSWFKDRPVSVSHAALGPEIGGCPHLRDVELSEVLVAAVRVLAASPVTIHKVVLLPEEG